MKRLWSRPRRRWSVVTTARWEAPYIAEWLAYHQAIGFDHVYLYCNDEDPGELYTAAAGWIEGPDPFVTFLHCPHQGQQWWMILNWLQTRKDETEWVAFLDVDEFLSLRRDADVGAFLRRRPEADCVYFYWAMFGHMGWAERPPGSVLRQYVRREAGLNPWTKTLTRTAAIDPSLLRTEVRGAIVHPHHGWDRKFSRPGLRSVDVLGADMADYWPDNGPSFERLFAEEGRTERVFAEAVVHHYAFRSEADFQRRVARGLGGDFGGQAMWDIPRSEAAARLEGLNAVEDRTLADLWVARLAERTGGRGMYPPPPGPLLSAGRPCLQSSVWNRGPEPVDPAEQAAGAVDGRALTGAPAFHTQAEAEPWWRVDLGAVQAVAEVRLYNRMDDSEMPERADRIRIAVSPDGESWRQVYARTAAGSFGGVDGRPLRWRPPRPLPARFVRLDLPGGVLHLEQVEVYGPGPRGT